MLHGYMSKKESFYYQIEEFSRSFLVIAPDFPGFGASSPLSLPWGVGEYAEWLKRFFRAQGIESAHILAHSFGARVAIRFCADNPRSVKKLVITGGAGIVKRDAAYCKKVARYRRVKRFFPRFAEKHFGSEEYRKLSPLMRESYKKIVNEDLRVYASRICAPTLLVYGEEDAVTPACAEGEIFSRAIPAAKLVKIGGGHFCFSENPLVFNPAVLEFLLN